MRFFLTRKVTDIEDSIKLRRIYKYLAIITIRNRNRNTIFRGLISNDKLSQDEWARSEKLTGEATCESILILSEGNNYLYPHLL